VLYKLNKAGILNKIEKHGGISYLSRIVAFSYEHLGGNHIGLKHYLTPVEKFPPNFSDL
jgi:hypothetical protein